MVARDKNSFIEKKNLIFSILNRAKKFHIDTKIFLLKDEAIKKISYVFNLGRMAKMRRNRVFSVITQPKGVINVGVRVNKKMSS